MAKLKVAQCWDDGVATDIRLIEMLRKYNAKATFNLCPGTHADERVEPSRAPEGFTGWSYKGFRGGKVGMKELVDIYGDFEVASHCWKHEVAGHCPDDVFIKAAVDAKKFLEDTFQKECRGFVYPCGGHTPATEQMLRDAGFVYARTTDTTFDVTACTNTMAFAANCHFAAEDFKERFEKAHEVGAFYFWGHSYEMMDQQELWDAFEDKLRMICEDPDVEWVSVADIAALCKQV